MKMRNEGMRHYFACTKIKKRRKKVAYKKEKTSPKKEKDKKF